MRSRYRPSHRYLNTANKDDVGSVVWPMQQVLVGEKNLRIVAWGNGTLLPELLAYDADITGFTQLTADQIIRDTINGLESGNAFDQQSQIWQDPSMMCNETHNWYQWCYEDANHHGVYKIPPPGDKYWISNLANTIGTGLFAEHSLRLNSSIECHNTTEDAYPASCEGPDTFSTVTSSDLPETAGNGTFEFRVCVPHGVKGFPWKLVRDRQDISERAYMQFNSDAVKYLTLNTSTKPVTLECSSETTAGYFAIPNKVGQVIAGPLLDSFNISAGPDPTEFINPESAGQSSSNDGPMLGYVFYLILIDFLEMCPLYRCQP